MLSRAVLIGVALALLAACGGNGGNGQGDLSVRIVRNPSPGVLCYDIEDAGSSGCVTPTPTP